MLENARSSVFLPANWKLAKQETGELFSRQLGKLPANFQTLLGRLQLLYCKFKIQRVAKRGEFRNWNPVNFWILRNIGLSNFHIVMKHAFKYLSIFDTMIKSKLRFYHLLEYMSTFGKTNHTYVRLPSMPAYTICAIVL